MVGEDDVPEDDDAHRRREEGCRREEAIRSLLKRHDDKRLTIGAVEEIAQELGVSRPTMCRLITAYRAKGTVSSVEPRAQGAQRAGTAQRHVGNCSRRGWRGTRPTTGSRGRFSPNG